MAKQWVLRAFSFAFFSLRQRKEGAKKNFFAYLNFNYSFFVSRNNYFQVFRRNKNQTINFLYLLSTLDQETSNGRESFLHLYTEEQKNTFFILKIV
jgi:hypothetical protein